MLFSRRSLFHSLVSLLMVDAPGRASDARTQRPQDAFVGRIARFQGKVFVVRANTPPIEVSRQIRLIAGDKIQFKSPDGTVTIVHHGIPARFEIRSPIAWVRIDARSVTQLIPLAGGKFREKNLSASELIGLPRIHKIHDVITATRLRAAGGFFQHAAPVGAIRPGKPIVLTWRNGFSAETAKATEILVTVRDAAGIRVTRLVPGDSDHFDIPADILKERAVYEWSAVPKSLKDVSATRAEGIFTVLSSADSEEIDAWVIRQKARIPTGGPDAIRRAAERDVWLEIAEELSRCGLYAEALEACLEVKRRDPANETVIELEDMLLRRLDGPLS